MGTPTPATRRIDSVPLPIRNRAWHRTEAVRHQVLRTVFTSQPDRLRELALVAAGILGNTIADALIVERNDSLAAELGAIFNESFQSVVTRRGLEVAIGFGIQIIRLDPPAAGQAVRT